MANCAYAKGANCKGMKIVIQKWYFYSTFKTKFIIVEIVRSKVTKANFLV
jgi:hypothetical protein